MQLSTFPQIAQSIATILALGIGGWWTWRRFIRTRAKYPKVRTGHSIHHSPIDDSWRLIRVSLRIDNQSEVLIKPGDVEARLLRIQPLPEEVKAALRADPSPNEIFDHMQMIQKNESDYRWPYVARRVIHPKIVEVEPNESEEYHFDFIVSRGLDTVAVYTFIKNRRKRRKDIGWQLTTMFDLNREGGLDEGRSTGKRER